MSPGCHPGIPPRKNGPPHAPERPPGQVKPARRLGETGGSRPKGRLASESHGARVYQGPHWAESAGRAPAWVRSIPLTGPGHRTPACRGA